ncbi:MAG TPA: methylated-DNA--[protein]-cysteine S-methyltransferase [Verrucomicrobiae bacterium]|nr:methylated-DNA--[protein]-cysteine S-methyltransferase [Verrucomicrobiae bacterium]
MKPNTTSYITLKTSRLGNLILVANATHLIGLYFADCEHVPVAQRDWKLDPKHPILRQAREEISEYLAGARKTFSIPIHYAGTDFQNEIWRQIALIPFGETITYTDLAQRAGNPNAVRAAGTATGSNRLGIIIPCHRVVGKNNALGGYAGGLDRKTHLLHLESNPGSFPRKASSQIPRRDRPGPTAK